MISDFGSNVFSDKVMKQRLPADVYDELRSVIDSTDKEITRELADKIAPIMMQWALEQGATHYTHWFQPLTNNTAEKHDSFLYYSNNNFILHFSGKQLTKGEADASSFPSGGARATFEARGYTMWDCTSPAFVKEAAGGSKILCIPTAFCSYNGDVLDKKTPLLRSINSLNRQAIRLLRLLGNKTTNKVTINIGAEQEYFLVDKDLYNKRTDLIFCGRTLFGAPAPKGQEKEDQYYAALRQRVISFMSDLNNELWKLGVPAKTQHNEAAPGQHELAPIFEDANIATDHNHLIMETMRRVADKQNLSCILHEKPFTDISGSGKHINWSLCTDDGINLLNPKHTDERVFLLFFMAVISAVDQYAALVRMSAANPANDFRLGGDEAPPAIVSVYIGDMLLDTLNEICDGQQTKTRKRELIKMGSTALPTLNKDYSDRNRTSPFAFTGDKFEFRMVGSSASISTPITVINSIVAQKVSQICDSLQSYANTDGLNDQTYAVIKNLITTHKRVIFNGNNYSAEWIEEAKQRGLPNINNCVDALAAYTEQQNIDMFSSLGIYRPTELTARYEIYLDNYIKTTTIDAKSMTTMARSQIVPSVVKYKKCLLDVIANSANYCSSDTEKQLVKEIDNNLNMVNQHIAELEQLTDKLAKSKSDTKHSQAVFARDNLVPLMKQLRKYADNLEKLCSKELWPFPNYADLLFSV